FLESLTANLGINEVYLVHSRAEDFGQQPKYRESFDLVTARAVAKMSVLAEYCLPLSKVGGTFAALKGTNVENELQEGKRAISVLGGQLNASHKFCLPIEEADRSIVIIDKVHQTKKKYPRKAGLPAKEPIM